jgi:hypothetical protein
MPDNIPSMVFTKKNENFNPIAVFSINGNVVLGVYKGSLGRFDLLLRYKQKNNHRWQWRTPKRIHWAVDVLLKKQQYEPLTKDFLGFLLGIWQETMPVVSEEERRSLSDIMEKFLQIHSADIEKFQQLNNAGEYSVRFLVLLAKLLMLQEKTNRPDAYMFKELLESIKNNNSLFEIISKASFGGRQKK